jgi:hypothetical protein
MAEWDATSTMNLGTDLLLIVGLSKVKRLAGPQNRDLHDQVP